MLIQNEYKPRMVKQKRTKIIPASSNMRIYIVLFFLITLFVLLIARVTYFQANSSNEWQEYGDKVFVRTIDVPANRGTIVDRNGSVLAINEPVRNLIIDTHQLPDFDMMYAKAKNEKAKQKIKQYQQEYQQYIIQFAGLLGEDVKKFQTMFDAKTYQGKKKHGDIYLRRGISKELSGQIDALKIAGVKLERTIKRRYPDGEYFGQVIGVTKVDTVQNNGSQEEQVVGLEGIEYAFNSLLEGQSGKKVMVRDNQGNFINAIDSTRNMPAQDGQNISLSLDKNIQASAMEALKKSVLYHRADSGSVVVLDAKTGEILAMANYPSFNPAEFNQYPSKVRRNHAVVDLLEPGSTFKPFVVAKALDNGIVSPNTVLNTNAYQIGKYTIKDVHNYPSLDVTGVLRKSSNVGSSKLALRMKADDLHQYYASLGFGSKPQSGFPGEAKGVLRSAQSWREVDKAVMSYGYSIQTSLLQLARGYTIFTNNGEILPVSFLRLNNAPKGSKIIKPEVANQVKKMLQTVTEKGGTGTRGAVNGYTVAAKSGTSQKIVGNSYSRNSHIALFSGFAPVSNPRVIIAVSIDNPKENGYYGGVVSAPVFSEVMSSTLNILGVAPDKTEAMDQLMLVKN